MIQKKNRNSYIMRQLTEKPMVTVAELCEAFQLSEVSVRKILDAMEKEGRIRRTWGGAVSAAGSMGEPSFEERMAQNWAQKCAIAQIAFDLIVDGDAVYLDSGTTAQQLARLLAAGHKRKVLVCTNALNVALEFRGAEDIELVFVGGHFQARMLSCCGGVAQEMLRKLYFDKAFLTGSHVSLERGFTTPSLQEAEIKRAVLASAKEVFILADSSKHGGDSLAIIAPAAEMGTWITDGALGAEAIHAFEAQGVRMLLPQEAQRPANKKGLPQASQTGKTRHQSAAKREISE